MIPLRYEHLPLVNIASAMLAQIPESAASLGTDMKTRTALSNRVLELVAALDRAEELGYKLVKI